jgi:hypothetical protein
MAIFVAFALMASGWWVDENRISTKMKRHSSTFYPELTWARYDLSTISNGCSFEERCILRNQPGTQFSTTEALGMYRRLRQRGQSSVLARLSVEARCADLSPAQRQQIRRLLREQEVVPA